MAENETPASVPPLADPYPQQSPKEALAPDPQAAAAEAGKIFELMQKDPAAAEKLGVGVAALRQEPAPEPEPLSKSVQGPIDLSHVMDAIGTLRQQNDQLFAQLSKLRGPTRFSS